MKQKYLNSVNLKSQSNFPYLVMDVTKERSLPKPPGFLVMHWHEDFQFILVLAGDVFIHTLDNTVIVHAGEGIFINKSVVHLVLGTDDCHYISFVFPEYLVTFYPGNPAQKYIKGISENKQLQTLVLSADISWNQSVLAILSELVRLEQQPSAIYEYEVLVKLTQIWFLIIQNVSISHSSFESQTTKRMRLFLDYMEQHYSEDISLDQLAAHANVSKSECLRCFKVSLQTTPYKYLMDYRLSKATAMLENTDEPVSKIANLVGFNQTSHFGKCFKKKTGYSPRDYRKKRQS